jgi:hypothetical protein
MSVWGKGPFEDDTSLDFRSDLIEYLIDRIEGPLEGKYRSMLSLYNVHSASEVLHMILRSFGGTLGKVRIEKWIKLTKEVVERAREQAALEPLDLELIEALDRSYLKLYEVAS